MEKDNKEERLHAINLECKEMLHSVKDRNPYNAIEMYGDRLEEILESNRDLDMKMSFDGAIMPLLWLWKVNKYGPMWESDYGEENRALNSCVSFFKIKRPK